ncbi:hypothetical protein Anapl_14217 [Anas platyrhynchos]|uniref:Uncharacterized protein n=1 Tax=Anas platyrhynchos TaxID=8839 RepID=R0JXC7_ANAPL|nr:hypothetical protein Anapl_14217 [Anas platyrhynchos]
MKAKAQEQLQHADSEFSLIKVSPVKAAYSRWMSVQMEKKKIEEDCNRILQKGPKAVKAQSWTVSPCLSRVAGVVVSSPVYNPASLKDLGSTLQNLMEVRGNKTWTSAVRKNFTEESAFCLVELVDFAVWFSSARFHMGVNFTKDKAPSSVLRGSISYQKVNAIGFTMFRMQPSIRTMSRAIVNKFTRLQS